MQQGDHHFRNVVLLWLLANAIMLPIVIWVLGPGLPPGNGTVQSHGQVVDNTVLLAIATPVALAVLVYFGYALWAFRERDPGGRSSTARRSAATRACSSGGSSRRPCWCCSWPATAPIRLLGGRLGRRPGTEPDRDAAGAATATAAQSSR